MDQQESSLQELNQKAQQALKDIDDALQDVSLSFNDADFSLTNQMPLTEQNGSSQQPLSQAFNQDESIGRVDNLTFSADMSLGNISHMDEHLNQNGHQSMDKTNQQQNSTSLDIAGIDAALDDALNMSMDISMRHSVTSDKDNAVQAAILPAETEQVLQSQSYQSHEAHVQTVQFSEDNERKKGDDLVSSQKPLQNNIVDIKSPDGSVHSTTSSDSMVDIKSYLKNVEANLNKELARVDQNLQNITMNASNVLVPKLKVKSYKLPAVSQIDDPELHALFNRPIQMPDETMLLDSQGINQKNAKAVYKRLPEVIQTPQGKSSKSAANVNSGQRKPTLPLPEIYPEDFTQQASSKHLQNVDTDLTKQIKEAELKLKASLQQQQNSSLKLNGQANPQFRDIELENSLFGPQEIKLPAEDDVVLQENQDEEKCEFERSYQRLPAAVVTAADHLWYSPTQYQPPMQQTSPQYKAKSPLQKVAVSENPPHQINIDITANDDLLQDDLVHLQQKPSISRAPTLVNMEHQAPPVFERSDDVKEQLDINDHRHTIDRLMAVIEKQSEMISHLQQEVQQIRIQQQKENHIMGNGKLQNHQHESGSEVVVLKSKIQLLERKLEYANLMVEQHRQDKEHAMKEAEFWRSQSRDYRPQGGSFPIHPANFVRSTIQKHLRSSVFAGNRVYSQSTRIPSYPLNSAHNSNSATTGAFSRSQRNYAVQDKTKSKYKPSLTSRQMPATSQYQKWNQSLGKNSQSHH
ncbi:hypothetical protein MIR68_001935 [Amoeboaphelidium protococcarum]|nr:hypothetical protein MIR68_001935 [Amoeboaphelidium protococcarum]